MRIASFALTRTHASRLRGEQGLWAARATSFGLWAVQVCLRSAAAARSSGGRACERTGVNTCHFPLGVRRVRRRGPLSRSEAAQRVGLGEIAMDGKGRCIDNVFVERLWHSLKRWGSRPSTFHLGSVGEGPHPGQKRRSDKGSRRGTFHLRLSYGRRMRRSQVSQVSQKCFALSWWRLCYVASGRS